MENLECIYEARKSFGGKAKIEYNCLYSYGEKVAELVDSQYIKIMEDVKLSKTVLRHIKEFAKQFANITLESKLIKEAQESGELIKN